MYKKSCTQVLNWIPTFSLFCAFSITSGRRFFGECFASEMLFELLANILFNLLNGGKCSPNLGSK